MDRTTVRRGIAIAFFLYAVYTASFVPGMLVAPAVPILLLGAIAKTALALACGIGIWTRQSWAPALVVLTGIVVAVLWLIYGFVLGIVAYLYGVAMSAVAVLVAIVVANYVRLRPDATYASRVSRASR
jgi:hypothetical protein